MPWSQIHDPFSNATLSMTDVPVGNLQRISAEQIGIPARCAWSPPASRLTVITR
jgi:hypothetical protein